MTGSSKRFSVLIIESSYPKDFYNRQLDGIAAQGLLNILEIRNQLRMVLNLKYFNEALHEAKRDGFHVIHLSCHGDKDGIALANNCQPTWADFAKLFLESDFAPQALVMSSCCGAASGIGDAFAESAKKRPEIIFGSKDKRTYGEYAVAWALLYHQFLAGGVTKPSAQMALKQISATVGDTFLYRRWDSRLKKYRMFPRKGAKYKVQES